MANVVIAGTATGATALPVASTIDGTNDYIPIYTATATATQAISRSTFLGVTGQPVDISATQTLSNKTLGVTNTVTLKDTLFTVQNAADTTKQAKFQLSGITTGNTRTFTLPDASDTVVGLAATQTLTNKTLTSPTVNAPTITNATITADTVSGFTVSNNGTIYGMSVTAGVLASAAIANQVNTAALQTNAVTAVKLDTAAITLGYVSATSNFVTASTTAVQVTGLTVTVTIPAGGRRVRITGYISKSLNSNISTVTASIWDGTVGSGTQLESWATTHSTASAGTGLNIQAIVQPAAGAKTYNFGILCDTGTETTQMSATSPGWILVEAI